MKQENLTKLAQKIGCTIEPKYFNIEDIANYQKLCDLEEKYKDTDNDMPVVFIGQYVLGGVKEIEANLEKKVKEYAEKGGVGWPDAVTLEKQNAPLTPALSREGRGGKETPEVAGKQIYLGFFYEYTCKECQRIFYLLNYLEKNNPNLVIKKFDLADNDNKILYEAIAEKTGIPFRKRLIPATLFIGPAYLQHKDITIAKIKPILEQYTAAGTPCAWEVSKQELAAADNRILTRFASFGIAAVSLAGLVDGINPCAFAVLVFFISYLAVIKKTGREIFLVGFSFMLAVFLVYFTIGCGAFSCLAKFSSYKHLSRILNILVGIGTLVLAVYSFRDYLKAKRGNLKEIALQLPAPIKNKIHSIIMRKMNLPNYVMGAFAAGALVSLLEFACTGQVYLPTIVFVTSRPEFRTQGVLYLALYNLMFVVPLGVILTFSYFGTASHKFARLAAKNVPVTKLLLTIFFLALGLFLILATTLSAQAGEERTIIARYTAAPVVIDGKLEEPVWKEAAVYSMFLGKDRETGGRSKPKENAEIRVCRDKNTLYVGIKFYDSDIVTKITEDQEFAYAYGDTLEVFLKGVKDPWYRELYATPNGRKTSLYIPGRGQTIEKPPQCIEGLFAAAQVEGTLNDWMDTDKYWTAEMAIPFDPEKDWCLLISRYNCTGDDSWTELSSCPQLPQTNFHLYEHYAILRLEK